MRSTVFGNVHLWLGGEAFEPGAFEVEDGSVTAVHRGDAPRIDVDLGGAYVMPGLIDAHFHLQQLGESMRTVRLEGTRSEAEAVERVRSAMSHGGFVPRFKSWLLGGGWDENLWDARALPTRASLAGVEQPVVMQRVDFHAIWVNDVALEIAGIDRETPDPSGGRIVRDARGEPTGVLVDNACDLVWRHVPPLSDAQIEDDVRCAMQRCARVGITCVHDMMMSPAVLAILERLEAAGELTVRVRAYMHGPFARSGEGSSMLRVCGVKLFADGALGSRGAALDTPYSDDPSTAGLLLMQPEELDASAARVHASGQQVAIHAIGDRAARLAVYAIEKAQGDSRGRRHRVEHAQTVGDALFERFARADITASMQPEHCACDRAWAIARLGPERMRGAYAWRTFLDHGVRLAFGSDAPIASEDPWRGIAAALAYESQRLSLREAMHAYTRAAADATHDDSLGALEVGACADFVVLDRDPFAETDVSKTRVTRTFVAGREIEVTGD